ncbi:MAG: hypothetical protein Q4D62_11700 [Planctomycetia bacterium]|nr:hypothetical protein [Planctomycetia bacterium]
MKQSGKTLLTRIMTGGTVFSFLCFFPWMCGAAPPSTPAETSAHYLTADLLLPETTCAYVSIRDFVHFKETWKTTELGKLLNTPEMQSVSENLGKQVQTHFEKVRERLGVTLDDVRQIAAGEIATGVLLTSSKKYAVVAIIDVRNHQIETQKVLGRVTERVLEVGGKHTKQMISDAEVYFLDIPDKKAANVSHKAIYVLKDDLLIASDDREVIQGILKRFAALKSDSETLLPCLADVDGYLNILENCLTGETLPDVVWYVDPIRYATVQRIVALEKNPMQVRSHSVAEMLTEAGFDGIEAVGGVVTLKTEGYDGVYRFFVSIPEEPQRSLKMLKFPETETFPIPSWVSANAGTVHWVNIDFLNLFDHLGPLFNQFFGEGDSGVWEDVLAGLEEDPYGPQINLREELFAFFENHLMFLVQNDRPEEVDGERRLVAIPLKDEEKVRDSMMRLLQDEPSIETVELENGDILWQALQDDDEEDDETEASKREPLFPEMALTVWNGYLMIASHADFLETVKNFDPQKGETLIASEEYRQIQKELREFAKQPHASLHYFHTARNSQHLYEMFRTGKIPQSTSLEAKRINQMFSTDVPQGETRKAMFDGSMLPPYESIRSYFLPSGATILNREKGFLFQGFWLSREKADGLMGKKDALSEISVTPVAPAPVEKSTEILEETEETLELPEETVEQPVETVEELDILPTL